jgi:thymidylate synthase (FAD)
MKLIKPSFEIIKQQPGEIGMLKHIETCGRVAWKSEERTTDDSYIKFVDMLKGVNHGSVLEHGTVYLHMKGGEASENLQGYYRNKYSIVKRKEEHFEIIDLYITTNYRVLVENDWLKDLQYQCEPTEFHEKRVTVRMICDIGVSREFNRHRIFSITEQSTRYCNFSKEQFGNGITCIMPTWLSEHHNFKYRNIDDSVIGVMQVGSVDSANYQYLSSLFESERRYFKLLKLGWKPQQARNVLPLSLKTEVIYTGFVSDWKHFFKLRTATGAHPQARELAIPLQEEFNRLGYGTKEEAN